MQKKFTISIRKVFTTLLTITFCLANSVNGCSKATLLSNIETENVTQVIDEKCTESINDELKKLLDDEKIEDKKENLQEEGKWRKFLRFIGRRGFYFLLGAMAPHLHLSQSDLAYAQNLTIGYILWKLSGDICSLIGFKDKKTREYTFKKIRKKSANLLMRLSAMMIMNKVVKNNIIYDNTIGYVYENIDVVCENMGIESQDRERLKNLFDKGINFGEDGIRYSCFSYIAKFIPKIFGC